MHFFMDLRKLLMMKRLTVIILMVVSISAFGQHKINTVLKKQLDSVMLLDQKYRDTLLLFMKPREGD